MRKAILISLAAAILASCSVKEDRRPCPCWLNIDLDGCQEYPTNVTVAAWNDRNIFMETVSTADYADGYERPVPKGEVISTVFCGLQRSTLSGSKITIPYGEQSDPIMAHRSIIQCSGEFARDTAVMYKHYANVYMKIETGEEGEYPYGLEVQSDVDGIDIPSLRPTSGAFRYPLTLTSDLTCHLRLPRQRVDSKPVIIVYDQGTEAGHLPLWEWINRTGYSWSDLDLKDIYIGVDYVRYEISITIEGWDDGDSMNIIL